MSLLLQPKKLIICGPIKMKIFPSKREKYLDYDKLAQLATSYDRAALTKAFAEIREHH